MDTSTLKADKAVQIDNASDLFDVYSVWDKVPWEDRTARRIDYSLIGGYLVLPAETSETTVYVVGSQVPASDYGDGTTTLPAFLERHLLAAGVADFYKSGGQLDKAMAEEAVAEEYLLQELDSTERLQSQNKVLVTPYPAMWPTLLVNQTTV